jgi:hypothetical protein
LGVFLFRILSLLSANQRPVQEHFSDRRCNLRKPPRRAEGRV